MRFFSADLHIHTCLSPCAELEMLPELIVRQAQKLGLQIIAVTDHNSAENAVWTGPPADPAQDEATLALLMSEPGAHVICGNTTVQIAARCLRADLQLEPRPADGWMEVPPTQILEGIDRVTEGLVTMGKVRERMVGAEQAKDLPRMQDGATRLARILLDADSVHFVVGLVLNPQQLDDTGAPLRRRLSRISSMI